MKHVLSKVSSHVSYRSSWGKSSPVAILFKRLTKRLAAISYSAILFFFFFCASALVTLLNFYKSQLPVEVQRQKRVFAIEPQLLPCTRVCGYKFHALAVYLYPTFTANPIGCAFEIQWNICGGAFCGNSQCIKAVGYFRGRASSWRFDWILNAILPNNFLYLHQTLPIFLDRT